MKTEPKDKYTKEWREWFYHSYKWQQKKAHILRRAEYACEECKRYGRMIEATEVHHVKHLEGYPELALDDSNLKALCKGCHNKQHPEKIRQATARRWKGRY